MHIVNGEGRQLKVRHEFTKCKVSSVCIFYDVQRIIICTQHRVIDGGTEHSEGLKLKCCM